MSALIRLHVHVYIFVVQPFQTFRKVWWCFGHFGIMSFTDMNNDTDDETGKPIMDLTGMADLWEQDASVREYLRIRKGEDQPVLFTDKFQVNVKSSVSDHIYGILKPLIERRAVLVEQPGPKVANLREQVDLFYKKMGIIVDGSQVILDSWFIRKLCAFIQMKTRKGIVSTVPRSLLSKDFIYFFWMHMNWKTWLRFS